MTLLGECRPTRKLLIINTYSETQNTRKNNAWENILCVVNIAVQILSACQSVCVNGGVVERMLTATFVQTNSSLQLLAFFAMLLCSWTEDKSTICRRGTMSGRSSEDGRVSLKLWPSRRKLPSILRHSAHSVDPQPLWSAIRAFTSKWYSESLSTIYSYSG